MDRRIRWLAVGFHTRHRYPSHRVILRKLLVLPLGGVGLWVGVAVQRTNNHT